MPILDFLVQKQLTEACVVSYVFDMVIDGVFSVAKLNESFMTNRNCLRLETPFIFPQLRFQSGLSTRPRDRQTLCDSKTNFKQLTFANKKQIQTIAICLVGDEEYYSFLEYEDVFPI